MLNLIFETETRVDEIRAKGRTGLTPKELTEVHRRWGEIVDQGLTINPEKVVARKYQPHIDARNLALALRDRRDMFLAYTTNPNIDWDNNGAERDFRLIRIQAKISGEFRSLHGAQRFATTRSYISTTIKHGISPPQKPGAPLHRPRRMAPTINNPDLSGYVQNTKHLLLRGETAAAQEWDFLAAGHNLLRVFRVVGVDVFITT